MKLRKKCFKFNEWIQEQTKNHRYFANWRGSTNEWKLTQKCEGSHLEAPDLGAGVVWDPEVEGRWREELNLKNKNKNKKRKKNLTDNLHPRVTKFVFMK